MFLSKHPVFSFARFFIESLSMPEKLENLESIIGYKFEDVSILNRAITHRSWAYEEITNGDDSKVRELQNETLEFVGDSVLGMVIAEQLYRRNSDASEGELTLMKHHLVSSETLGKLALELGLGKFMRVGKGEEKTGGRKKRALLADTFEAIIAAIFFDGGYEAASDFVKGVFKKQLIEVTPRSSLDFKTLFQEKLQAQKRAAPVYEVLEAEGPSHDRRFLVEARWDKGQTQGRGTSIKAAEMQAASLALEELETEEKNQVAKSNV